MEYMELSVLLSQLFYKSKTILKLKVYLKKIQGLDIEISSNSGIVSGRT